jgi:hypothetical protein
MQKICPKYKLALVKRPSFISQPSKTPSPIYEKERETESEKERLRKELENVCDVIIHSYIGKFS